MKKFLLIAGGGTLGTYTAKELLKQGGEVEVICLEDKISDTKNLRFYKENADFKYLEKFLADKYYDGIINFIHYTDIEEYKKVHMLISSKTDHMIFLSSYRVYADLQHPITERAPQLYDVVDDKDFLSDEDYAVPKSKCEHFIKEESNTSNWTIVRPVISFSHIRFDIVSENYKVIERIKNGEKIYLPKSAKKLTAGLDWAGNSGKLIARLLLCDKAKKEAYTISSAQNLTWGEIADLYTKLLGAKLEWVGMDEYLEKRPDLKAHPFGLKYDRLFDRKIDNSKVLEATGLKQSDFSSIEDGIKTEIENYERGDK